MWKKWRTTHSKNEEYRPEREKSTQDKLTALGGDLKKIEDILEEAKKKEEERSELEKIEKEKKRKLLKEKEKADNRKLIKEVEKMERKHQKKILEEK